MFGENEWKERDIPGNEKYMPKGSKFSFLEKNYKTELSKKENELLDRNVGYKNIDELLAVFNNTKTDKMLDELFDKIDNRLKILKKLIEAVSDITERKRINNVIKGVQFVLDQTEFDKNISYSDTDNKQDFSDSEFSDSDLD